MTSYLTQQFLDRYRRLPESVREQARECYRLFEADPQHPSLRFKRVHPQEPIYSARVGSDYRVVGQLAGDAIRWFWIGTHGEYDQVLKRL